jgi:hypothetical protein
MKTRKLFFIGFIALFFSGCVVYSFYPLYTEKDLFPNTLLLGEWLDEDGTEWKFEYAYKGKKVPENMDSTSYILTQKYKALKSQLNPHFLFNSLNSIYSLARKNSSLVPEKIVQLSDLMRHIIYESDVEFIPLEKEVEMVKKFIEPQNLRSVEPDRIKLEIKGEIKGKKIAPLLFLPFVENSFKHGLKSGIP